MTTQPGSFKWRLYWTDKDWGAYICAEAGQRLDFEKFERSPETELFRHIAVVWNLPGV